MHHRANNIDEAAIRPWALSASGSRGFEHMKELYGTYFFFDACELYRILPMGFERPLDCNSGLYTILVHSFLFLSLYATSLVA